MSQPDFDAIVVGAGAGGASSAFFLAQAGLQVLVLEKSRLPRYKACGGAVPRSTLERFPFSLETVLRGTPAEVRFTYPGLPTVDVPLPERPVSMVMRSDFDAFLLAQADVEVLDGTEVVGISERQGSVEVEADDGSRLVRKLSASYLIGADGATSTVARSLGLRSNRLLGGALEAEVAVDVRSTAVTEAGDRAVFCLGVVPWGYAWVFPKGEFSSVGIGCFRKGRVDLRGAFHRVMQTMGIDTTGVRLYGHPIPIYQAPPWRKWHRRPQERLSTRRCLLVGDAAGLVDPLLGEGIRYAIASARLAEQAVVNGNLAGYETTIWREIGHTLATAGMVAKLFYRWPRHCYKLGVRNPVTVNHFVDLMTERADYRGIARRIAVATIAWLAGGRLDARFEDHCRPAGEVGLL